jgi:phage baseplate assembly protein W
MAKTSRTFVDLDAAFTLNPISRDVAVKTDDAAIRGALRNLINTKHYERPFQPDLGCQLVNLLFENMDPLTLILAERVIGESITKYEPRISLTNVSVSSQEDNSVFISIEYLIKNTQQPAIFTTTFSRVR